MKKKLAALVLLVLALGAGFLLWTSSHTSSGSEAPPSMDQERPAKAQTPAPTRAMSAHIIFVRPELDPAGTLRLEGQVIDASTEEGVGGARVAIDSVPARIVTTEDDGSFALTGLTSRRYTLEAHAGKLYASPVHLRLDEQSEPVILRMREAQAMAIEVRSSIDHEPIAGAEIELRSQLNWHAGLRWSSLSGADGRARFVGLPRGELSLHVGAPGYAGYAGRITTSGADTQVIELKPGIEVHGILVDEQGEPVADARVTASPASEPFPLADPELDGASTDAAGVFRIPGLSPNSYRFTISHPEMIAANMSPILITETSSPIRLVARRGGVLAGLVTSQNNEPVEGARVGYAVQGSVPWRTRRSAITDAQGAFRFSALPPGSADVVASSPEGASIASVVSMKAGGTLSLELQLELSKGIEGTVVDAAGEELPEAQVLIEPVWSGSLGERNAWSARDTHLRVADAGGRFRFGGLPEGEYHLRATAAGSSPGALALAPVTRARSGATGLQLVAAQDVQVTGQVAYQDGGPVPLFRVHLGGGMPIAVADREGRFALSLPAGLHRLRIAGPSFAPSFAEADARAGDVDLGTLSVTRGRSIAGTVVDEEGSPVEGAQVAAGALLTGGGNSLFIEDESIMARATRSDAEGRFAIDGLGQHAISLIAGLEGRGRSRALQIPGGPIGVEVTLSLEPSSSLRGRITRSGEPIAESVVLATPIGTSAMSFVVSGTDGSYVYDALTPGEYMIYPMIGGGGNKPKDMFIKTITIESGQSAVCDIDAPSGEGSASVSVLDHQGKLAAAHVLLFRADNAPEHPATLDSFINGSWLRGFDSADPIAVYLRQAISAPASFENLVGATYLGCAAQRSLEPGPPSGPVVCDELIVSPTGAASLQLVLPAPSVEPGSAPGN